MISPSGSLFAAAGHEAVEELLVEQVPAHQPKKSAYEPI